MHTKCVYANPSLPTIPPFSLLSPLVTISLFSMYVFRGETTIQKDTCTPMFIAALFTLARTWKQPKCLLMKEWKIHKKEINNVLCSNMDWPRDCHNEWNKSDRERQIPYDIAYMWNLLKKKWYQQAYLQNINRVRDAERFLMQGRFCTFGFEDARDCVTKNMCSLEKVRVAPRWEPAKKWGLQTCSHTGKQFTRGQEWTGKQIPL